MAGVINGESSGNKEESLALGTAIINAGNNGGWSLEKLISSSDFTRAILSSRYKDFINAAHNKRHAFLSCINAFKYQSGEFDAIDLSKGALLWEGGELAAKGSEHPKVKFYGIDIPIYHWDQFKIYWNGKGKTALERDYETEEVADIKDYINPKKTAYWLKATDKNDNRLLIKSTAVVGATMFFGRNTGDPRNTNYPWKYLTTYKSK